MDQLAHLEPNITQSGRVSDAHPDLNEQTLADTVEGLTNLHDIIAAIIRSADEALAQGLKGRITEMQERFRRF